MVHQGEVSDFYELTYSSLKNASGSKGTLKQSEKVLQIPVEIVV